MKKTISILIASLICLTAFSQKIVDNPKFSATTASNVKITKIEIYDTITALHFEVTYFPKWWIHVSVEKTFIQNSKGGEKLYVKRAEGIELNKKSDTPESGKNIYTLYFPPIDKSIETINYEEEQWKIFDLEIVPHKSVSIIPQELQGNWLRTDGSNEWLYGFYNNMVICDNEFWDKILITNKGKEYKIILQKNNQIRELYIKLKNDNLLIGPDPKKLELFSQNKTFRKDFVIKNDEDFKLPVFKMDTAIYKGYIKGYHPKMNKTGMVYVNDILTQEQNSNIITINPDGTFYAKCFMLYPQIVFVRMFGFSENIYLEPGKTSFHFIDASEFTAPFKSNSDQKKRERKSLFMGECARINADLQSTDSISYFDYQNIQKQVLDMGAQQYKTYCLEVMKKEEESFQRYMESNLTSQKAITIRKWQIPYQAWQNILSYNMHKESAYRQKNKIPREQREIPLEREEFGPDFLNFIQPKDLNNPVSLVSGGAYNILINRIRFADVVRPKRGYLFTILADTLKAKSINLLSEEEEFLKKLSACKTSECINSSMKQDSLLWKNFMAKYKDVYSSVNKYAFEYVTHKNLQQYFGLSDGLAREIMFAQSMCNKMKGFYKPFSDEEKSEIKKAIKTDFILDYLMLLSKAKEDELAKKVSETREKTGYVVNATPKAEGDKLFDAIMQKYRGKVVFVDFWATWCGPCRSGIENMKTLKEELKDKDIVFVYITDESSPIDTWNLMISDIKGEHFRLNNDEWNYLKSKFNISGIPHYVLVNKAGTVIKDKIYFASSNSEFRQILNDSLK